MIDYDTSGGLPIGALGWTRVLKAIEQALPTDESEWVEFKAGVDPNDAAGRAHIARAILAFANRDPHRAARWLGGHALVVVGLEPGHNSGCPQIDPAQVHDGVQRLLKPPAPDWDPAYHLYDGKHVLVITVSPPTQGDPIALPARSSDVLVDGRVYVRKPGKSEQATSDDIRRLEARVKQVTAAPTVTLTATMDGPLHRAEPDEGWVDRWLSAERDRLLRSLEAEIAKRRPANPLPWNLDKAIRSAEETNPLRDTAAAMSRHSAVNRATLIRSLTEDPEDRTEQQYREAVDAYIDECRTKLPSAVGLLLAARAPEVEWQVTNDSPNNLEQVQVKAHLEGRISQVDAPRDPLRDVCPRPPRLWGPKPKVNAADAALRGMVRSQPYVPSLSVGPRTEITNSGSVDIVFAPLHLRPHETKTLHVVTGLTLARDFEGSEVRCTWTATATNVPGEVEGALTLGIAPDPLDLAADLEHQPPSKGRGIRPSGD